MMYATLDKVVKGYLLQRRYPMHFYIEFLVYAARAFSEISFDSIGNIRTVRLNINDTAAATLPIDYMEWVKIGVIKGQFVRPLHQRESINNLNNYDTNGIIATLGTVDPGSAYTDGVYTGVSLTGGTGTGATADITIVTASSVQTILVTLVNPGIDYSVGDSLSALAADIGGTGTGFSVPVASVSSTGKILYPGNFQSYGSEYWYFNTGTNYGGTIDYADGFKVIPERNEIQLQGAVNANDIILEYISDGSQIDNATQITPYATATLEAFINWKMKENARSYNEGERMRAQRQFEQQHRILRARMDPLTISDIKQIIYRNTLAAPK